MSNHEAETRAAVALVPQVLTDIHYAVERACKHQDDALDRMSSALGDAEEIFDEFPDSRVIDRDQAERLQEAFEYLAASALAQVARLRVRHPEIASE